jgi:hypothetical protein
MSLEGSTPSPSAFRIGTVSEGVWNPEFKVPDTFLKQFAPVVKRTSRLGPNEVFRVQLLAGALFIALALSIR